MHSNAISDDKIFLAATILKNKKACAPDRIPSEYWKCFCNKSITRMWAVKLCNAVWNHNEIPDSWHDALATAGFKEGDVSLCAKYQPIVRLADTGACCWPLLSTSALKLSEAERLVPDTAHRSFVKPNLSNKSG